MYFRTAPWLAMFPGLAIFYAVLGFNLLGYGVPAAARAMTFWQRRALVGRRACGARAYVGCRTGGGRLRNFRPRAKVLRLADADDIPTLDPAAGYDTVSWTFEQAIFDTLVRYGEDNVELEPDLATSWESAPDAMSFTFHLRRDARFSTGRAVTSDDFQLRDRARDRSGNAFEGDGVLPRDRGRRWISRRIARCMSAESRRPTRRRSSFI